MKAEVFVGGIFAGILEEEKRGKSYTFTYDEGYKGDSVSLTMPTTQLIYRFDRFPPFFEGLLPEGFMLDALLRKAKIDRNDLFRQLITVGEDMVGDVTVRGIP